VTSGQLIRQARLRAGLSQQELAGRIGRPAPQIARWERDTVEPGLGTIRSVLRACGYDLSLELIEFDPSLDAELIVELRKAPAERWLDQADALRAIATKGADAQRAAGLDPLPAFATWDPWRLVARLQEGQCDYIIIGAFAAQLHGLGLPSTNVDICPAVRPSNIEKLNRALRALQARWAERKVRASKHAVFQLDTDATTIGPILLQTNDGLLRIVPVPAGTHGFDDLRRAAVVWPFVGLMPRIASLDDIVRMVGATGRPRDQQRMPRLLRLLELSATLPPDPDAASITRAYENRARRGSDAPADAAP
jgi:transcriptional regulator with XRE-family HTH domain